MTTGQRVRRFVEDLGFGRVSSREAYTVDPDLLPVPIEGAEWHEAAFDENHEVNKDPGLLKVLDAARRYGIEIVKRIA